MADFNNALAVEKITLNAYPTVAADGACNEQTLVFANQEELSEHGYTLAQLGQILANLSGIGYKRQRSRAAAAERIFKVLDNAPSFAPVAEAKPQPDQPEANVEQAEPAPTQAKTTRSKYDDAARITWLTADNPKRPGTKCHARAETYWGQPTVGDVLANGGTRADINYAVNKGFIQVAA